MSIDDFLGPNPKVVDLLSQERWGAIDELLHNLVTARKIKSEHLNALTAAVNEREKSMSTGIGFGIGIPHACTDLVPDVIAAIGRSRIGIEFNSPDGKLVSLVVLFLIPTGQFQKYSDTLARLAKLLHRHDFRDKLWERFM
jgi:mannitol/fructose-specific phosphotransferase system IIA component (Ntr-type)